MAPHKGEDTENWIIVENVASLEQKGEIKHKWTHQIYVYKHEMKT